MKILAGAQKRKNEDLPIKLAKPSAMKAFGKRRIEVTMGREDEAWAEKWGIDRSSRVVFAARSNEGLSAVVSNLPFTAYRNGAKSKYSVAGGSAFVSSSDILEVWAESGYSMAIKFSMLMDPAPFPIDFPLIAEVGPMGENLIDLARFSIPLRISMYDFPDSPFEAMAFEMAKAGTAGQKHDANRGQHVQLDASDWPRLLCAYGKRMRLFGNDLSEGLVAVIPPKDKLLLELSRHPEMKENMFYPSFGTIFIAEYRE